MTAVWLWGPNAVGRSMWSIKVIRGPAGPTLVSAAADAQLLIVGHGHHVIDMMHRSVSWYCVRHAHCLMRVIPAAAATRRTLVGPVAATAQVEPTAVTTATGIAEVTAAAPLQLLRT